MKYSSFDTHSAPVSFESQTVTHSDASSPENAAQETHENHLRALEREIEEVRQENRLRLLQLHHIEHDLTEESKLKRACEERLHMFDALMRERLPGLCIADSVRLHACVNMAFYQELECHLTDVQRANHKWSKITIRLARRDGDSGLIIETSEDSKPVGLAVDGSGEIVSNPLEFFPDSAKHGLELKKLSAAAWLTLRGLVDLLVYTFEQRKYSVADDISPSDILAWLEVARELKTKLCQTPPSFRYDAIRLVQNYIYPGYEHLWLEFQNVHVEDKFLPLLQLKFGATQISDETFTKSGRLEFRESGSCAPLDMWNHAEKDNFGSLVRLTIQPGKEISWPEMATATDKSFLMQTVHALPGLLPRLQRNNHIDRPWDDWIGLAAELAAHPALQFAAETATPAPENQISLHQAPATPSIPPQEAAPSPVEPIQQAMPPEIDSADQTTPPELLLAPSVATENAPAAVSTCTDTGVTEDANVPEASASFESPSAEGTDFSEMPSESSAAMDEPAAVEVISPQTPPPVPEIPYVAAELLAIQDMDSTEVLHIALRGLVWPANYHRDFIFRVIGIGLHQTQFPPSMTLTFRSSDNPTSPLDSLETAPEDQWGRVLRLAISDHLSDDEKIAWLPVSDADRVLLSFLVQKLPTFIAQTYASRKENPEHLQKWLQLAEATHHRFALL